MLRAATNRSTKCRALLRAVAAATRVALAFALLFALVHSGTRYFYCEAMGLQLVDPCAQGISDEGQRESRLALSTAHAADCCEIVTLPAMPQGSQAAAPSVAPAALVAILPAFCLVASTVSPASPADRAFGKWRPPPRASRDLRQQRMVFLI
jgi:hypothetical protein